MSFLLRERKFRNESLSLKKEKEISMKNIIGSLFSLRAKGRDQRGFTLLEYCAGAAILIGIIFGAVTAMGTSVNTLMNSITGWSNARASEVNPQ